MPSNSTFSQQIVFYDDARARTFQPFALSRPLSEMRAGALLVRERWELALRGKASGFVSSPQLAQFEEAGAPASIDTVIPRGTIVVNSRAVVALSDAAGDADVWMLDGKVAAIRLRSDVDVASMENGSAPLEQFVSSAETDHGRATVNGYWMHEVWDYVRILTPLLVSDIPIVAAGLDCSTASTTANGPVVAGSHPVFVEQGAEVEAFTYFDTTLGPILLRAGSHVHAFTRVVGPFYLGVNSSVAGDKLSGSSIGDTCRVHGELSASIFIGHSNKGHDGFVGHSILGRWVNLGAGTTTSNLKNTYGTVALWTPEGVRDTGLQFLGTLFGDHVKTGIGLRLTTGCVLGTAANVFDAMPPKVVAPFSWGQGAPYMLFDDSKFLETAARMMQRRQVEMTEGMRQYLQSVFHARWKVS